MIIRVHKNQFVACFIHNNMLYTHEKASSIGSETSGSSSYMTRFLPENLFRYNDFTTRSIDFSGSFALGVNLVKLVAIIKNCNY